MGNLSFQIGFDLLGSGEAIPYSFKPELYPGEDVGVLPVVQNLPLVEDGISVRESEPMPLKEELNENPIEQNNGPSTETPFLQNLESQSSQLPAEARSAVNEERSSVVVSLPSDSFRFASGMSHIGSSQSREYLKNLGAFLSENDQAFQRLVIVGHTDKRGPAGREREVNMELSEARAKSVFEALVAGGAKAEKLRYEGKAFDAPVEGAPDNPKGWKLNRRVELNLEGVSNSESLVEGINQLNEKFGIKQKAKLK
jgi:flagellar motor protein MotB